MQDFFSFLFRPFLRFKQLMDEAADEPYISRMTEKIEETARQQPTDAATLMPGVGMDDSGL